MNKKILYLLVVVAIALYSCKSEEKSSPISKAVPDKQKSDSIIQVIKQKEEIENKLTTVPKSEAVIKFDDENFDFKDIIKGNIVTHEFSFINNGNEPLIISEVRPSCGCTSPTFTREPVAPGKKGSITIKFDSSNFEEHVIKTVLVAGNFKPTELKFKANIIKK